LYLLFPPQHFGVSRLIFDINFLVLKPKFFCIIRGPAPDHTERPSTIYRALPPLCKGFSHFPHLSLFKTKIQFSRAFLFPSFQSPFHTPLQSFKYLFYHEANPEPPQFQTLTLLVYLEDNICVRCFRFALVLFFPFNKSRYLYVCLVPIPPN